MINTKLFSPANLLIIGLIAVATHILAKPLYAAIDSQ